MLITSGKPKTIFKFGDGSFFSRNTKCYFQKQTKMRKGDSFVCVDSIRMHIHIYAKYNFRTVAGISVSMHFIVRGLLMLVFSFFVQTHFVFCFFGCNAITTFHKIVCVCVNFFPGL